MSEENDSSKIEKNTIYTVSSKGWEFVSAAEFANDHKNDIKLERNKMGATNELINLLKQSLNIHWQQTTVLTAQATHLDRWGYKKLAAVLKDDAAEERFHAMVNIERLEFFDSDYQPLVVTPPPWPRHDMVGLIKYNLNSVREAAVVEKSTIITARQSADEITANMMIPLLQGSEDGIRLYEGYLKLIEEMGLDNFLTLQT